MKIGIDIQALQTESSKNRGIGRYSENMLKMIFKNDSENEFLLFQNNLYDEKLKFDLPNNAKIKSLSLIEPKNSSERNLNNLIQFLEYNNSNLDVLLILSPFEGFPSKFPVTNRYIERLNLTVCTIIYDLIPLNYPDHYFSNPEFKTEYFKNLKILFHSDFLFSISDSTRNDAINILGIHPKKIVSIKGAPSTNFFKIKNISINKILKLKKKYNIKKNFILYTGGIEFRKNIESSIKAFSKIDKDKLSDTSYVIVCEIHPQDKLRLDKLAQDYKIADNLILTGFIPDDELNILYNSCNGFIFPSLIEGLGIPVLEAMKCGAPVIGSNTSSIKELIKEKELTFNPTNQNEITISINRLLGDHPFKQRAKKNSLYQSQNYDWDLVAKKLISSYKNLKTKEPNSDLQKKLHKPRIAYFSPLPPKKSGISYYSRDLLPLLSKKWDIDLFIDDDYYCDDPYLIANFEIYPFQNFEEISKKRPYDKIIYQIGNSDNHIFMFDILKKYPGIVVIHDVFLGGVIYWMTAKKGKLEEFIDEVIYSHGEKGKNLVEKAKKNMIPWDNLIWNLPINKRIVDAASHVVVHSVWDKENITNLYPDLENKISIVHQFAPIKIFSEKQNIKIELGFSKDDFLICSFGFVVTTKKIDLIIKNLKKFLDENPNTKYVIVGELDSHYGNIIKNLINDLNYSDRILITGFVDELTYKKYLAICDVCVSFREKTRAGTSASINHSLGAGIPTIISDVSPFNEFPDDVVRKIKPSEEKNLSQILEELYKNSEICHSLGKKGKEFVEKYLSKDACVDKYNSIIQKTLDTSVPTKKS